MSARKLPHSPYGPRGQIAFTTDTTTSKVLRELAKSRNCSVSVIVNEAVRTYIDKLK